MGGGIGNAVTAGALGVMQNGANGSFSGAVGSASNPLGELTQSTFGGGSQIPAINPQLQQMEQQQINAATQFGNNLPAYVKQQQNAATDTSRQNLAQTLAGTTQNSNARGLLYGGYNQGQQANATVQNQAQLGVTNENINTNAQNTLSQMQSAALGQGVALQGQQQTLNQQAYQQALAQMQAQNQGVGSLLGGIGSIGGLLAKGAG